MLYLVETGLDHSRLPQTRSKRISERGVSSRGFSQRIAHHSMITAACLGPAGQCSTAWLVPGGRSFASRPAPYYNEQLYPRQRDKRVLPSCLAGRRLRVISVNLSKPSIPAPPDRGIPIRWESHDDFRGGRQLLLLVWPAAARAHSLGTSASSMQDRR